MNSSTVDIFSGRPHICSSLLFNSSIVIDPLLSSSNSSNVARTSRENWLNGSLLGSSRNSFFEFFLKKWFSDKVANEYKFGTKEHWKNIFHYKRNTSGKGEETEICKVTSQYHDNRFCIAGTNWIHDPSFCELIITAIVNLDKFRYWNRIDFLIRTMSGCWLWRHGRRFRWWPSLSNFAHLLYYTNWVERLFLVILLLTKPCRFSSL